MKESNLDLILVAFCGYFFISYSCLLVLDLLLSCVITTAHISIFVTVPSTLGLRLRDIRSVDPSLWFMNSMPSLLVMKLFLIPVVCYFIYCAALDVVSFFCFEVIWYKMKYYYLLERNHWFIREFRSFHEEHGILLPSASCLKQCSTTYVASCISSVSCVDSCFI